MLSLLKELAAYMSARKKWWLLPILVLMVVLGVFVFLSGTAAAPMTIMDATATPFSFFEANAGNDGIFEAILPSRDIIGELNVKRNADAALSAKIPLTSEESEIDEHLNGILWRSCFGSSRPEPRRNHKFAASPGIELR